MTFAGVNGVTLHHRLSGPGAGAPVVFVNSLGTDSRIWDEVAARLGPGRRTLRYDKRGHGLSDAPIGPYTVRDHADDLEGLLERLGLEGVVLVGVSVGGMVALELAAAHPERVRGLVLCDTGLAIGTAETWNARIEAARAGGLESIADAVLSRWFAPRFLEDRPDEASGYRAMLARTPLEGYVGTCAAIREADMRGAARAVRAPALVVCGAEDIASPPSLSRELAGVMGAPLELIEGAGHLPCVERPLETARLVAGFLERLEGGAATRLERGMAMRRAVLGDAHVDRAGAATTELDADFQQYITENVWGEVWARPGLERRARHLVTLAVLAALGKEHELALHVRATANTGVTPEELREVFLQVGVYAGVPSANRAFGIAKPILTERDSIKGGPREPEAGR